MCIRPMADLSANAGHQYFAGPHLVTMWPTLGTISSIKEMCHQQMNQPISTYNETDLHS